ncbi:MAG: hypothetical protein AB7F35_00715 [Acetobacteraceae bacterium]
MTLGINLPPTTDEQLFGLIVTADHLAHDAINLLHARGYSDEQIERGVERQAGRQREEEMA